VRHDPGACGDVDMERNLKFSLGNLMAQVG
jgi:hypothetical protein